MECQDKYNIAIIVFQGIFLFLSEILPFVKKTGCNGISHAIYRLMTSECLVNEDPTAEFITTITTDGILKEIRKDNFK